MKRITILILVLIALGISPSQTVRADETSYYAKVEKNDVFFYATPDTSSRLFELPTSYFVNLTANANEEFYVATYKDVTGYVKKNEVTPMQGSPAEPFAETNMCVFDMDGFGLYKQPSLLSSDIVATVPYLCSNITYYGRMEGNAIPNKSKVWYYCRFNDNETSTLGYMYSVFCDVSPIEVNNEFLPVISTPLFSNVVKTSQGLSDIAKTFIVLGVSLPCALIIYLLVKPTLSSSHAGATKVKRKRRRHGDYFEFDENDLT